MNILNSHRRQFSENEKHLNGHLEDKFQKNASLNVTLNANLADDISAF